VNRKLLLILALIASCSVVVGSVIVRGASSSLRAQKVAAVKKLSRAERLALARVTNRGTPFVFPSTAAGEAAMLDQRGFTSFDVLSSRDGISLFRVTSSDPNLQHCYAVGRDTNTTHPIGGIKCRAAAPYFPSTSKPILDMSLTGADRNGSRSIQYLSLTGVASDGVAAINVLDGNGNILLKVPVVSNSYVAVSVPSGAVALEAIDSSGDVLQRVP
jgi:hypothetical protein